MFWIALITLCSVNRLYQIAVLCDGMIFNVNVYAPAYVLYSGDNTFLSLSVACLARFQFKYNIIVN